ncbi:MAG: EamA family transporter RarD, partial [Candidatus Marinimicrobia bacterium]|nr:EamA family transporter RarD [Candidatus Neomarinimicrobiota bacterium]
MNRGVIYAILAYALWGLLPVYWKLLQAAPALEILSHRVVWSLLFGLLVLAVRNRWQWLGAAVRSPRVMAAFIAAAALLSFNWYIYIWAVNSGNILDASLGYFINPLLTVALGVIFMAERPRPWQWFSIAIALVGVLYLTFGHGSFPWVAMGLALTFSLYGLIKKTATLDSLEGVSLESAIMFLPALGYLLYLAQTGAGAFGAIDIKLTLLLASTGVITAIPLILFAGAARRIPLTTLGLLQYIAPTLQFLMGALVYHES